MESQTLANVFGGPGSQGSTTQLFSLADIEKTAKLAAADTVDNARSLVDSLVATAKDQLLDVSLTGIMLGAWTKLRAIQEFATGEKLQSDATHKFVLSEHKITSKHSPKIELFVYENKVTEVTVDITLALVIAKTNLAIKKGRILEVKISGCKAMGTISCHGQKLLERESTEIDFPAAIKLGKGIAIPPPLKLKVT